MRWPIKLLTKVDVAGLVALLDRGLDALVLSFRRGVVARDQVVRVDLEDHRRLLLCDLEEHARVKVGLHQAELGE